MSSTNSQLAGACQRAITDLTPYSSEAPVAAIIYRLRRLADTTADPLAKSLVEAERERVRIRKGESSTVSPAVREKLEKASRDAQLEYLHKASPAAAAAYERGREQAA